MFTALLLYPTDELLNAAKILFTRLVRLKTALGDGWFHGKKKVGFEETMTEVYISPGEYGYFGDIVAWAECVRIEL